MTLVNENRSEFTGKDYTTVLKNAGLESVFEDAWGVSIDADRLESDLGSVSEDRLIEKTLEESDDRWVFLMSGSNDGTQPRYDSIQYHVVPVEE